MTIFPVFKKMFHTGKKLSFELQQELLQKFISERRLDTDGVRVLSTMNDYYTLQNMWWGTLTNEWSD